MNAYWTNEQQLLFKDYLTESSGAFYSRRFPYTTYKGIGNFAYSPRRSVD